MEQSRPLGELFLRTVWIFQAIAAGPTFVWFGLAAIFNLFNTFEGVYEFVTHLSTALLAAGIIFIVVVQRNIPPHKTSKSLTLRFEIAKSILATALWLWLMLDAIFGPSTHYNPYYPRSRRITVSAIASVLLFILFYPTVFYAAHRLRQSSYAEGENGERVDGERQPLLQE